MQTLAAPQAECQPARPPAASRGPADRPFQPAREAERVVLSVPAATHAPVHQVQPGFRLRRPVLILGEIPDLDLVLERFDRGGTVRVCGGGLA
jgi:hypothetical protein